MVVSIVPRVVLHQVDGQRGYRVTADDQDIGQLYNATTGRWHALTATGAPTVTMRRAVAIGELLTAAGLPTY